MKIRDIVFENDTQEVYLNIIRGELVETMNATAKEAKETYGGCVVKSYAVEDAPETDEKGKKKAARITIVAEVEADGAGD